MSVIAFQGEIESGQIRLTADVRLLDKMKIYVVVPEFEPNDDKKKFDLAEMVARMPADYQTKEKSFGALVGEEE